ncbi:MAG: SUMF1/EgtB/PvdO family nonheme iron enzyme [Thermoguttaceae bacterium]|nr:SUMF1/EgtB/PvdO family nonheme iron enzyme [Thermoguttaceae bacterium]
MVDKIKCRNWFCGLGIIVALFLSSNNCVWGGNLVAGGGSESASDAQRRDFIRELLVAGGASDEVLLVAFQEAENEEVRELLEKILLRRLEQKEEQEARDFVTLVQNEYEKAKSKWGNAEPERLKPLRLLWFKSMRCLNVMTQKQYRGAEEQNRSHDLKKAGERMTLTIKGVEYAFRWCPPGTFTMGSPENEEYRNENETQHQVTLTRGFWILETEVTVGMWCSVLGESSTFLPHDAQADHPISCADWEDFQKLIKALNAVGVAPEGLTFRLPTEAEWEYACRAGTTTPFFWGESLNGKKNANCNGIIPYGSVERGDVSYDLWPVASQTPNAWGIYDMHGNVWEWCSDWYGRYPSAATTDPVGPSWGNERVLRGGGFRSYAPRCRAAMRGHAGDDSDEFKIQQGGRLVLGAPLEAQENATSDLTSHDTRESGNAVTKREDTFTPVTSTRVNNESSTNVSETLEAPEARCINCRNTQKCDRCNGRGLNSAGRACVHCQGTGQCILCKEPTKVLQGYCFHCDGDRKCQMCKGEKPDDPWDFCGWCGGTGKCNECMGKGKVPVYGF